MNERVDLCMPFHSEPERLRDALCFSAGDKRHAHMRRDQKIVPRLHSCSKPIEAPLTSCGTVTTSNRSSKIAGFRKSIVIEQTTKAKPGASCRASFSSSR